MNDTDTDYEARLSQLVDGELGSDEVNRILLRVLRSEDSRVALLRMLQLRHTLAPWRQHGEDLPEIKPLRGTSRSISKFKRALVAVAAVLAISVSALVYHNVAQNNSISGDRGFASVGRPVAPPLSREDAARVLRLHESVAGPVAWLAILPDSVRVQKTTEVSGDSQPIVCFLNIQSRGEENFPTTPDLIICRLEEKVTLSIPSGSGQPTAMRIQLVAVHREGLLGLQYAISLKDRLPTDPHTATLTGFIPFSGNSRTVGQLAHAGTTLDVALRASLLTPDSNG